MTIQLIERETAIETEITITITITITMWCDVAISN